MAPAWRATARARTCVTNKDVQKCDSLNQLKALRACWKRENLWVVTLCSGSCRKPILPTSEQVELMDAMQFKSVKQEREYMEQMMD